jgi:hypothetical protein
MESIRIIDPSTGGNSLMNRCTVVSCGNGLSPQRRRPGSGLFLVENNSKSKEIPRSGNFAKKALYFILFTI